MSGAISNSNVQFYKILTPSHLEKKSNNPAANKPRDYALCTAISCHRLLMLHNRYKVPNHNLFTPMKTTLSAELPHSFLVHPSCPPCQESTKNESDSHYELGKES